MKLTRYAFLVLVLLAVYGSVSGQSQESRKDHLRKRLDSFIRNAMDLNKTPGLAIVVVQNGEVVYERGFGTKSLNTREPITPNSLFHLASVTKPFVATAIMQLVEQGKIDLDAPIIKYLPYFVMKDDRYKTITVRQMLTHTSGMPDTEYYAWDKPEYDDQALERHIRSLKSQSLIAAPGAEDSYSNIAFEVLGDLIAHVSGESFENYVQRHILQPLGMRQSTLLLKQTKARLLTSPHVLDHSGNLVVSGVFPYNRIHAASSTLYSNLTDMKRWLLANLNRGTLDGMQILKPESYEIMWKPSSEKFKENGLSWFLKSYRDNPTVSHDGSDVGFTSNMVLIPSRSLGVVVMSNSFYGPTGAISNAALDLALGFEPKLGLGTPTDWNSFTGEFANDQLGTAKVELVM